jgi:hypothetical protein
MIVPKYLGAASSLAARYIGNWFVVLPNLHPVEEIELMDLVIHITTTVTRHGIDSGVGSWLESSF